MGNVRLKKILFLLIAISLTTPGCAQQEQVVEIPIIFSQGDVEMKTSTCLRIREKTYGTKSAAWKHFKNTAQAGPEKALTETISAMQNKNAPRLKALSHPEFGRDPKKFKEQASTYFQQFAVFQIGDVKSYLKFDNLVVFFVQVEYGEGKSHFADFSFMYDENANYDFLPYKIKSLVLQLAGDWFRSDWGPAKNKTASYCKPSLVSKITHKVVLDHGIHKDSAAELLLVGLNLHDTNKKSVPYADLLHQIASMKRAIKSNKLDDFFDGFTEHAKKQNRDWFLSEESEYLRNQYVKNFVA